MIITIDGPAGVGKSTIAKLLAEKLNFSYFDTGAMYRSVTYALIKNQIDIDNEKEVVNFLNTNFNYEIKDENSKKVYFVNGENVSEIIRSNYITSLVSNVSSKKYVRDFLVPFQRKFAEGINMVCEGRDMGSKVFPNADLKIYLTARASVRAERRFRQLIEKYPQDIGNLDKNKILFEIQKRDNQDSTREASPLKKADDAILIDTSKLTAEIVVKKVLKKLYKKKMRFFYRAILFIFKFILHNFYRYKIYGTKNILSKAAIIAANHTSFLDPPAIAIAFNEEIYFLGKETLFKIPIFKRIIKALNTLPISQNESNIQTIKTIDHLMKMNKKIVLFPEGSRSYDGNLTKLLPGIGFLINLTKTSIIPTYIYGTHAAWGKKKFPTLFKKIYCIFGTPIKFEEFEKVSKDQRNEFIVNRIEASLSNLQKWARDGFIGDPP